MLPTGPTNSSPVAAVEGYRSLASAELSSCVDAAWHTYRWEPLPDHSQATAWLRLLEFAAHLLGHTPPGEKPTACDTGAVTFHLARWLQIIHLTLDDAVAWLIDPENEPDPLLEMLMQAAIADLSNQIADTAMLHTYRLRSVEQRIALVRQLRNTYAVVDESLAGMPDWAMSDELPALHSLCVQEVSAQALQP